MDIVVEVAGEEGPRAHETSSMSVAGMFLHAPPICRKIIFTKVPFVVITGTTSVVVIGSIIVS